jgi:hypothetical protein
MIGARGSWRSPLVAFAIASLGVGVGACGSMSKDAERPAGVVSAASPMSDEDADSQGQSAYLDGDDGAVSHSGHAASARDTRAISTLVRSYYAAAATGRGAKACALLYYLVAESLPEEYARPPGPLYLKSADSCPALMSRVFAHFHAQMASPPTVTAVRVGGDRAYALLGWKSSPAGFIEARLEGRVWKLEQPLALPLP